MNRLLSETPNLSSPYSQVIMRLVATPRWLYNLFVQIRLGELQVLPRLTSLLYYNWLSAGSAFSELTFRSLYPCLIVTTILGNLDACSLINAKPRISSLRRAIGNRIVYILAYRIRRWDSVNTGGYYCNKSVSSPTNWFSSMFRLIWDIDNHSFYCEWI